jgi:hypothetical protein
MSGIDPARRSSQRAQLRLPSLPPLAAAALGFTLMCASLAGCRQAQTDAATAKPARPAETVVQPPAPQPIANPAPNTAVALRVSRLSRIVRQPGVGAVIDLRLDAVDASGRPASVGGEIRVVLEAPGAVPEAHAYDFMLRSVEEAEMHLDATLRQYVLRIDPSWATPPASGSTLTVRVTLTDASGATTTAVGSLRW